MPLLDISSMRSVRSVLRSIIARGHYSEKDAANLMKDAFGALLYLHDLGIVHRDLKPENLLYASNDEKSPMYDVIKVADFGLAKVVQGGNDHSMTTTCGTPGYVAPEVLEQKGGYGPEVDVWSMGVILYILLCGFPPFYDENNAVLFQQIKKGDYSFPSPYWDDISDGAKDLVKKILQINPQTRLTIQQCLEHPWMATASDAPLTSQQEQLKKFAARGRFKKAIHTVRTRSPTVERGTPCRCIRQSN